MTIEEVARLLKIIKACSPSFVTAEGTTAAWADLLADIPAEAAIAAVRAHFVNNGPWIGISDIRKRVAAAAGVLPPDPESALAQARALLAWYGPIGSGPDPATRPTVHPATEATIDTLGMERVATINAYDWRAAYTPKAEEFQARTLAPGGIHKARAAIEAERPTPKPAIETPPESGATFDRIAALRSRIRGRMARLDEAVAELGDGARYLTDGRDPASPYGFAAVRSWLTARGWDSDPAAAERAARQEVARHRGSGSAEAFEATRAASLRALETMMAASEAQ